MTLYPAGRRMEAERRAEEMLLSYLDAEQRHTLAARGWFEVKPPRRFARPPGRTYRITPQRGGWVEERRAGETRQLGIYPADRYEVYPASDGALAVMLLILHDEDALLSVACVS